ILSHSLDPALFRPQDTSAVMLHHLHSSAHASLADEVSTLSLHDALPIYGSFWEESQPNAQGIAQELTARQLEEAETEIQRCMKRSEAHTSELQSRFDLVCRLLLEKTNTRIIRLRPR